MKSNYKSLDMLQKIIVVNAIIYLFVNLGDVLLRLFNFPDGIISGFLTDWLAVPSSVKSLLYRPWTLITYSFYHENFLHILFNMLWLFFMGRLFTEYLGEKKLLTLYLVGGLCGSVLFIVFYNLFPLFSREVDIAVALGASASVLAITVAIATLLPDYEVGLFLPQWRVKLKYIAIALFVIDLLSITGNNAGGNIAHIGGAIFGFIYIKQLKNGRDLTGWLQRLIERITQKKKPSIKVVYRKDASDESYHNKKANNQEAIDKILDKISRSGYASLTYEERDILFKASKNQD
ncbi:MAG TPA: rhomboid family intramembrane serine protease [Bacteroidia bacterium]|nr:rhomboid family intramembrane serine protease [Bacteroidia bacterium]HMX96331.1 rhomboid family intramembrane serine protease [Bacteroidia bacterium]HNB11502.1 rhomboid family intramembrane serine protease [Bacteroidia bacterium]HND70674.1 rhomboid family intramembrane serine protease [Bacteroidia bacterium]HNN10214.1 rhomboid family intramembrane serine protease [Bacteroidia bacterium]